MSNLLQHLGIHSERTQEHSLVKMLFFLKNKMIFEYVQKYKEKVEELSQITKYIKLFYNNTYHLFKK